MFEWTVEFFVFLSSGLESSVIAARFFPPSVGYKACCGCLRPIVSRSCIISAAGTCQISWHESFSLNGMTTTLSVSFAFEDGLILPESTSSGIRMTGSGIGGAVDGRSGCARNTGGQCRDATGVS